jgi:threonine aldolase
VLNPTRKSFGSDNHAGVHPAVMAALADANAGDAIAYGDDDLSRRSIDRMRTASGAADVFLVFNGTAANVLGISLLLRPYEGVICAESSHLNVDECGAAERVLGTKLLTVGTPDGRLTPELIATRLTGRGDEHRVQPRVVQLAQVTETGTCYSLAELRAIRDFCDREGLLVYIDGARLANAVAYLDCALADVAACADILSFGGTKNGAMGVEAVLVMTPGLARLAGPFHRKQQMQLSSKMRFLSAQLLGLLEGDVWLENARHANAMAARLAAGVADVPGIRLAYPTESNGVFAELDTGRVRALQADWTFHIWSGGDNGGCVVRWMTAFDTSVADVDALVSAVKAQS